MTSRHRIRIARDLFKFSCAHMTVFPDGTAERLHGHNYFAEVELDLADVSFENIVDFGPIKEAVVEQCCEWKEHLLLAERNPHFAIAVQDDREIDFTLCGKRYVVPREDVILLPVDNISVEALSALIADRLIAALSASWPAGVVVGVGVSVTESPGQGASTFRSLG